MPPDFVSLEFAWPWVFAALPLPLLAARLLPEADVVAGSSLRFPLAYLPPSATVHGRITGLRPRLWLAVLTWILLVMAAARPQWISETAPAPVAGRSMMLAVDISASMQSRDMAVDGQQSTRLAAVKRFAGEFIERRVGDRLGLLLFADQAYIQVPLSFDRETLGILLNEAEIGLAGKNTALGDAIGLAIKRLREAPEAQRVLLLLTDGANTAGSVAPAKAAELAAIEHVRIYTIGIGGDPKRRRGPFGMIQRPDSDLDEPTLQAIADQTGGRYFRARDAVALREVYDVIDAIEPAELEVERHRVVEERYRWPLTVALLLSFALAMPRRMQSSSTDAKADVDAGVDAKVDGDARV